MDKISCGGFYIGEGLELEDKVLKVTDGSDGGCVVVATPNGAPVGSETPATMSMPLVDFLEVCENNAPAMCKFAAGGGMFFMLYIDTYSEISGTKTFTFKPATGNAMLSKIVWNCDSSGNESAYIHAATA